MVWKVSENRNSVMFLSLSESFRMDDVTGESPKHHGCRTIDSEAMAKRPDPLDRVTVLNGKLARKNLDHGLGTYSTLRLLDTFDVILLAESGRLTISPQP
ncbi:hypothetical protein IAQ61_003134 [Plenodomus lingam]|uniref:uncharacterized protein n=1 Tax=Leptosphaeria maculans TaxID=5022 RepID=UPI00331D80BF|nr:hypothetical protein IAQ61_003134 [Plenodomus lingam]